MIGGLDRLLRLADRIEQRIQVARAIAQRLRGEEVAGIVERGIDLLAGGQPVLRRGHKVGRFLQRKQVLSNAGGKDDVAHDGFLIEMTLRRPTQAIAPDNDPVTLMGRKQSPNLW